MSTELSNGVIIPEEYSDDWYDEMSINLRKLNDVITAASDNATDIQRLDTDKANQSDLTALTSRVSQNETDITALQTAVSGALKREIVQTLPTEDISTTTIYMIRNSQSSGTNIYDEYMYINNLWELIGTSATDFSNYYTKNETDNLLSAKANQTDLTSLGGRVTQTETDITALQTAVSGALKREIVQTLPTEDISTTTIYMIRNSQSSGTNIYDEYMYINNLWELIGTSATDFSNYYTKTEIDTLLSYKASDSDVVHKSGNETVNGLKTFSKYITSDGSVAGDEYTSNAKTNLWLMGNRDVENVSGILFDTYRQNTAQGTGIHILGIGIKENNVRYEGCRWGWYWDNNLNGYSFDFKPTTQGANQAVKHNLGTSIDKWDTINGLNPSSLGMPNLSNGVDISSYITVNGGNKESFYTPTVNGWISVALTRTGGANMAVMLKQGNFASSGHNITQENGTTTCNAMLPVKGGVQVSINSALADGIHFAYFYPCQGNI